MGAPNPQRDRQEAVEEAPTGENGQEEIPNEPFSFEIPFHYANSIHLAASFHDLRMSFGVSPTGAGVTKFSAVMCLPWQAAKQFQGMLSRAIESYENEIGPINTEPKPITTEPKNDEQPPSDASE